MSKNLKRIEQARELLGMIESVDCGDGDALDEIDSRWWCLLRGFEYVGTVNGAHMYDGKTWDGKQCGHRCGDGFEDYPMAPDYSRSRDALKSARPEGWYLYDVMRYDGKLCKGFGYELKEFRGSGETSSSGAILLTEELAEFYCIVQAWIYVWENK